MKKLLVLLGLFPLLVSAEICYFIPPEKWERILPDAASPYVQIAYIGSSATHLRPSLNLATEEIDTNLKEYLKAVREIHEKEMGMRWKDLGEFRFQSGKGRLTEITSQSPVGEIKLLQGIFVKDKIAYILTGSVIKDEFPEFRNMLLAAMRSLTVAADLFSPVTDLAKKERLLKLFQQFDALCSPEEREKEWLSFQKILQAEYQSYGPYWNFLVEKEALARLFPAEPVPKPASL